MSAALAATAVSYAVDGSVLVDRVTLAVESGRLLAVVGPNGAGKSTLLALLAGDLDPAEGSVELLGMPIERHSARELAVRRAVLLQQSAPVFSFLVGEIVSMGRTPHHDRRSRATRSREAEDDLLERAMRDADVTHLVTRQITTLSAGERSRVMLAHVLAQDTPVLLLDEPTASLDIRHQHLVLHAVRNRARQGRTVVVVLHDLSLAAAYADEVAIMRSGRVQTIGSPGDVLEETVLTSVFEHPIRVVHGPRGEILVVPVPERSETHPAVRG